MTEVILILFAAGIIYYVATRIAPHGLVFKLKKDEVAPVKSQAEPEKVVTKEEGLVKEGEILLNRGQLEVAEKKFLEAVKLNPNAAEPYQFLGMIYLRQNLNTGAVAALEKACKLDPLDDTAFNNLGNAYSNLHKWEEAIQNFEKSISLNDKIAHRYLNLAVAYQKLKNWDKAAISLEAAVRIHPNSENLTLLAKNYESMGNEKLVQQTIDRLLEIDPKNAWAKRHFSEAK